MEVSEEQHNIEIHENMQKWKKKPLLHKIYSDFYSLIASQLNRKVPGKIVELGSGIGNMKMVVPDVICTDIFPNPWIDQVENAYNLTFEDNSVSNLILFDVFHHLKFPGDALNGFHRVLNTGGRVIIFDPAMSITGMIVYGLLHHEPIALFKKIKWFSNHSDAGEKETYYAAQGNTSRIFFTSNYNEKLKEWNIIGKKKLSALSYILSGGYSKYQMYPQRMHSLIKKIEIFFNLFPLFFSTRLIVVLEKK